MKLDDVRELKSLCERAIEDVRAFRTGTPYEHLGLANTFRSLCAPLMRGNELDPVIRGAIPAVQLHGLEKAIQRLGSAMIFNQSSVDSEYLPALSLIGAALGGAESALEANSPKLKGSQSVFYSWQATLPSSTNRGFIRDCLNRAVEQVNAGVELEDSLRVDSDTSGRPGAPKIFPTILQKIESCRLFVADVSLVEGRQCNSNVMVELGYALKVLGENRIVMVFNEAYGALRDLPFDLSFNRQIVYRLAETDDKAEQRKKLTSILKLALQPTLEDA